MGSQSPCSLSCTEQVTESSFPHHSTTKNCGDPRGWDWHKPKPTSHRSRMELGARDRHTRNDDAEHRVTAPEDRRVPLQPGLCGVLGWSPPPHPSAELARRQLLTFPRLSAPRGDASKAGAGRPAWYPEPQGPPGRQVPQARTPPRARKRRAGAAPPPPPVLARLPPILARLAPPPMRGAPEVLT